VTSNDWGYVDSEGNYTGGWSGSDASRDRAVGEARSGRVQKRQQKVWNAVRLAGLDGMTWWEVGAALGMHHGAASGALSNLHKAGRLVRLKERRGGSSVYVLPHAVNGRDIAPHGRVRAAAAPVGTESQPEAQDGHTATAGEQQEAWDAAYLKGKADGSDEGWQRGYDEGVAAGAAEGERLAMDSGIARRAYNDGIERGAKQERARFQNYLAALEVEINRLGANRALGGHHNKCWLQHPACLLRTIQKAVQP
jgi:hypothetical protein